MPDINFHAHSLAAWLLSMLKRQVGGLAASQELPRQEEGEEVVTTATGTTSMGPVPRHGRPPGYPSLPDGQLKIQAWQDGRFGRALKDRGLPPFHARPSSPRVGGNPRVMEDSLEPIQASPAERWNKYLYIKSQSRAMTQPEKGNRPSVKVHETEVV